MVYAAHQFDQLADVDGRSESIASWWERPVVARKAAMGRLRARAPKSSHGSSAKYSNRAIGQGQPSLHVEFPDEVASVIRPFLFEETGPFCLVVPLG
jgi:hypothetical protein